MAAHKKDRKAKHGMKDLKPRKKAKGGKVQMQDFHFLDKASTNIGGGGDENI